MNDQQQIGEYRVLQKIGAGGMGKVFLAVHRDVPNLKVILKTLTDARLADRFRQEADKLALLDGHPNICRIKHFFQYGDELVIAMEYIEGLTLDKKYELEGQPSINEAVRIICEMLDILEFAHGKGVAHRDIKPSNVMIDKGGRIKIIDFGIAKAETDPHLTMAGAGLGTPAYMAPEQFNPTPNTNFAIADVYAVGTCLYFLLTGKLPFKGDNEFAMRDAKLFSKPTRPREFNPQISKKLENIILRALDPEPTKRFVSAVAMRKELEGVMRDLPESTPMPDETVAMVDDHRTPAPPPRPPKKRGKGVFIGGAMVVVILAAVGIWYFAGGGGTGIKPPALSSPGEGTVISDAAQFEFSWSAAKAAGASYLFEILAPTAEGHPLVRRTTSATSVKIDTTMNNGDYAWRVLAVAGTDSSAFSRSRKFTLALPPPVVPRGVVSVRINEPSDLYIDGNLWQRDTRQAQAQFDTGQHVIQVENADASPSTIVDTIALVEGATVPLSYQMNIKSGPPPKPPVRAKVGRLRIASSPRGAGIILDGNETGQVTIFTFNDLKPGNHDVRLMPLEGSTAPIFDTTVTVVQDSLVIMVHEF